MHNIIRYAFEGKLFPPNPGAELVHTIKCYKNMREIPGPVDLAVIVVPRAKVLKVVDDCKTWWITGI